MMPLSKSIALRSELMTTYLDEFAARHPGYSRLVGKLRGRVALSHRAGMLWGWTVAEDDRERRACVESFGDGAVDEVLRRVLLWADHRGLRPHRTGTHLGRAARTAANIFGL